MQQTTDEQATSRLQTACLLVLTFIAVGAAMALLKPVLVPFVLAIFFTYCLAPLVDFQTEKLHAPRWLAILGTAIVGLAAMTLIGVILAVAVKAMSDNFDTYQQQLDQFLNRIARSAPLQRLGIKPDRESGMLFNIPENAIRSFFSAVVSETTSIISNGAIVVIFVMFMLLGKSGTISRTDTVLSQCEQRVKKYINQVVLFSFATGFVVTLILAILGVKFAFLFGFLAFLLNFVPTIGSIIATLLPIPVLMLSPELSITSKILALALPGAFQLLIGSIVQPKIQGSSLQLHPVAVLMSLIFFGMIWGLAGAFLATPILAVIKIILKRIPETVPVARLLEGRTDWSSP